MTLSLGEFTPISFVDSGQLDMYSDWTDFFDRISIIKKANEVIDELIREIQGLQLDIHKGLDSWELALLYRFPIHVGVNIFIERLLRVAYSREMGWNRQYPNVSFQPNYFKDTDEAVTTYYVDFAFNNSFLHKIQIVLGGPETSEGVTASKQPKPQDPLLNRPSSTRDMAKKVFKKIIEGYVKISKPQVIGEYSNWMREILPFSQMLSFHYQAQHYPVDSTTRNEISNCCRTVFLRRIDTVLDQLETQQKIDLADLFAGCLDRIIPQSIVEGLPERFSYFEDLIRNWKVQQVHSFIGYYYKENFKIFAILARRKGALLIGHAHGASNPRPVYRQIKNELFFVDYYFTWGKRDSEWIAGDQLIEKQKIFGLGSTYLQNISKWSKKTIDKQQWTILYLSGPLVDFMTDLEETATREKTLDHRLNVLALLKDLRKVYPNIKVLYKPFPGTYTNDPIKVYFAQEMINKVVQITTSRPVDVYPKVDIVLWDCISTGFFESIQSGIPTIVFQSPKEYEQASVLGKKLNQELMKCGILFHDRLIGLKSIHRVLNNLTEFIKAGAVAVRIFQESTACPVSKKEFHRKFSQIIKKE